MPRHVRVAEWPSAAAAGSCIKRHLANYADPVPRPTFMFLRLSYAAEQEECPSSAITVRDHFYFGWRVSRGADVAPGCSHNPTLLPTHAQLGAVTSTSNKLIPWASGLVFLADWGDDSYAGEV